MMKHLPNIFTIFRIALTPLLVILLVLSLGGNHDYVVWAFGIFVFASLTDWVDGFLARALDAKSELGAKLDLFADKLLVGLTIVGIGIYEMLAGQFDKIIIMGAIVFMLLATTARDYFVTQMRSEAEKTGFSMPATFLAKTKTAVIMMGMAIYLGAMAFGFKNLIMVGILVTLVGALMSLFTGVQYLQKFNANKKI